MGLINQATMILVAKIAVKEKDEQNNTKTEQRKCKSKEEIQVKLIMSSYMYTKTSEQGTISRMLLKRILRYEHQSQLSRIADHLLTKKELLLHQHRMEKSNYIVFSILSRHSHRPPSCGNLLFR